MCAGGGGVPECSYYLGCHGCSLGGVFPGDCVRVLCIEGLGGGQLVGQSIGQCKMVRNYAILGIRDRVKKIGMNSG